MSGQKRFIENSWLLALSATMGVLGTAAMTATAAHADSVSNSRVVCEAVSPKDAVAFAQQNHFVFNQSPIDESPAPYVAPKGTLNCTMPMNATPIDDDLGVFAYLASPVRPADLGAALPSCTITYFDGTAPATFPMSSTDSDCYVDSVASKKDDDSQGMCTVNFNGPDKGAITDFIPVVEVGQTPQIQWLPEAVDDKGDQPLIPILAKCHVEVDGYPAN